MLLVVDSASPDRVREFARRIVTLSNESQMLQALDGPLEDETARVRAVAQDRDALHIFRGSWLGKDNSWDYEWQIGRAFQSLGLKLFLGQFAEEFPDGTGLTWDVESDPHAASILGRIARLRHGPQPQFYAGPIRPPVVVLGQMSRSPRLLPQTGPADRWLPFSSRFGTRLARTLGNAALRIGWGYIDGDPREQLWDAEVIVTFGKAAKQYAEGLGHRPVAFPSLLNVYLWKSMGHRVPGIEAATEAAFRAAVAPALGLGDAREGDLTNG